MKTKPSPDEIPVTFNRNGIAIPRGFVQALIVPYALNNTVKRGKMALIWKRQYGTLICKIPAKKRKTSNHSQSSSARRFREGLGQGP